MRIPFFHREGRDNPKDVRSGRVVAVIHCVLNQNTRDFGASIHPGVSETILSVLVKHKVGILQMPCPEMACLGLLRSRPKGLSLREALDTPCGRRWCRAIGRSVADQIEEHARAGHRVLAVVGGDVESPGCAVHLLPEEQSVQGSLAEPSGVFMKVLESELRSRDLYVPFLAMRESSPSDFQEDIERLERLLGQGAG